MARGYAGISSSENTVSKAGVIGNLQNSIDILSYYFVFAKRFRGLFGIKIKLFSVNMTLITVVYYDFVIFNRLKSHTFEKSTVLSCGCFSEIPARKNKFDFFVPPFLRTS